MHTQTNIIKKYKALGPRAKGKRVPSTRGPALVVFSQQHRARVVGLVRMGRKSSEEQGAKRREDRGGDEGDGGKKRRRAAHISICRL